MEHVVFFTSPDGASVFRRTPDLEGAVRFVEQMRNADGVEDAQVYSLSHVPLAFKTYVRVEVPALDQPVPLPEPLRPEPEPEPEPVAEAAEPEPVAEVAPEPVVDVVPEPVAEPVAEMVPEPVAEVVTEPVVEVFSEAVAEPAPEPVAEVFSEAVAVAADPVAADAPPWAPGMDVLPGEDFVTAEGTGRNGRARGMGFFSR